MKKLLPILAIILPFGFLMYGAYWYFYIYKKQVPEPPSPSFPPDEEGLISGATITNFIPIGVQAKLQTIDFQLINPINVILHTPQKLGSLSAGDTIRIDESKYNGTYPIFQINTDDNEIKSFVIIVDYIGDDNAKIYTV